MTSIPRPSTPKDETLWRDTGFYRNYARPRFPETMVMHYFAASHFFDPASRNGQLTQQIAHNADLREQVTSQAVFDRMLAGMRGAGTEYVIAAGAEDAGVWVIEERWRDAHGLAHVRAVYYMLGENIYQAPSVGAVLQNRCVRRPPAAALACRVPTELTPDSSTSRATCARP